MAKNDTSRGVKTTKTVFGIIELLQESDGATLTEIADGLDLAPSTVHEHLISLTSENYIIKEDSRYYLGLQFLDRGIHARNRLQVTHAAPPSLIQLAEETGELVSLVVEEQGHAVFLLQEKGENAINVRARAGMRSYLHCLASGKAILSELSDKKVEEIIDQHGMYPATEDTITGREELFDELQMIREQGYASTAGEITEGLSAVGAPIIADGTLHGGVSVSGPKNRFSREYVNENLLDELLTATNEIELRLKSK